MKKGNPIGRRIEVSTVRLLRSTEVGCSTNTIKEGGVYMNLEVVESGGCGPENKDTGCEDFMVGCCIIHFWCWSPGQGLCC